MNSGAPDSPESRAVLMALWDALPQEMAVDELLHRTRLPMERLQRGLSELMQTAGSAGGAGAGRIERTPGGIRLVTVGLARWRDVIEELAARQGWRLGRNVVVVPQTTSTNDVAWQRAGGTDGLVVIADEQTAGRGRFGHRWHARAGQSVLLSAVLHQESRERADRLTLLVGLAAATALERAVTWAGGGGGPRLQVAIKWPNDLMVKGRKIGGILIEQRKVAGPSPEMVDAVVVGVGLNVTQSAEEFPAELAGLAISLFEAGGAMVDRLRVCAFLLENLNRYLAREIGEGGEAGWLAEWKSRCALWGQRVEARSGERHYAGQVVDIEPLHGLVLRDDGGATHFLSAQTTTLLP